METKTLNLTLNRWHKVQARLQAEITNLHREVSSRFSPITVTVATLKSSDATVKSQHSAGSAAFERLSELRSALSCIRAKLGEANGLNGVTAKLAELEDTNQRIGSVRQILAQYQVDGMQLSEVSLDASAVSYQQAKVNILTPEDAAKFKSELENLTSASHRLADELSDLNQKKLQLDISALAASVAGVE